MACIVKTGTQKCYAEGRFISWMAVYWEAMPDGRKFRRRKAGFDTKAAAEAYLRDLREAAHLGDVSHKSRTVPTLAKFIELYTEQVLIDKRPKTRTRNLLTLKQFVEFIGRKGKVRLDSISVQQIEGFKAARLSRCQPNTVCRDLESLRGLFGTAVRYDLLRENPVSKVAKPKVPEKEVVYLEPEEQKALIRAAQELPATAKAHTPFLAAMIVLCLNTGLRRGELFHLRWGDVDLEARRLYVRNSEGFMTKSGKMRVVGLNKHAIDALTEWMGWFDAIQVKGKKLLRSKDTQRQERGRRCLALVERCSPRADRLTCPLELERKLVFPSLKCLDAEGQTKPLENVDSGLEHAVRLAGLKRRVGLHVLRHTFAVNLCRAGASLYKISRLMGHASVQTTEQHYLRFTKDEGIEVVDLLVCWFEKGEVCK